MPKDRQGYDAVMPVMDRFAKRPTAIPRGKIVDAKETARLYIQYLYRFYRPPLTIVSDRGCYGTQATGLDCGSLRHERSQAIFTSPTRPNSSLSSVD